jgi:hypothetical protein
MARRNQATARARRAFSSFPGTLCVSAFLCITLSQPAIGMDAARILGVSKLSVRQGHVELTRDIATAYGLQLTLDGIENHDPTGDETSAQVDVAIGESFTVSDGHHYAIRYTLLGTRNAVASMEILNQSRFPGFDSRSPPKQTAEYHDYSPRPSGT